MTLSTTGKTPMEKFMEELLNNLTDPLFTLPILIKLKITKKNLKELSP